MCIIVPFRCKDAEDAMGISTQVTVALNTEAFVVLRIFQVTIAQVRFNITIIFISLSFS